MDIKDNVTRLFDYKMNKQKVKEDELEQSRFEHEQRCNALFVRQHSDDDSFENHNEFEFKGSDDKDRR